MNGVYVVTTINGKVPPAVEGRGNSYQLTVLETGISISLGCSNIAIEGEVANGVFIASDAVGGGVVSGSGTCKIPIERQLEPKLHAHLLAGEVKVTQGSGTITLEAPDLVVEAQRR